MPSDSSDFLDSEAGFARPRHVLRNLAMLSPLLVMIPGAVLLFMRHDRENEAEAEVRRHTLEVAEAIWKAEDEEESTVEEVAPPSGLIPTKGLARAPEMEEEPKKPEPAVVAEVVKAPEKVEPEKPTASPVIVVGTVTPKPAPAAPKKASDQHQVRKGETLYSISRLYKKSPDQLAAYNRIRVSDPIREGQMLRLTANPKLPAPAPVSADNFMNLTPVSGHAAKSLAKPLPHADDITPLPMYCIEYQVQAFDTLESIAAAHGTSVQTITVLNGTAAVNAGQTIVVPVDEILGRVR